MLPDRHRTRQPLSIMPKTYKVEKLVDFKMQGKKELFLVKWQGYNESENTWEPVENLGDGFAKEMAALEKKVEKAKERDKKKPPTPGAGALGTRFMTTKPSRDSAGKRAPDPPPAPEPKKAKLEPKQRSPPKKPVIDIKELAYAIMAELGETPPEYEPK